MRRLQDAFVEPLTVLPFDELAAEHYAEIRLSLESRGQPIGERDQMIAAVARSLGLVLITNNTRELERVPGLVLEDWTQM